MTTVIFFKNGYERFSEIDPLLIPSIGDRIRLEDGIFVVTQKTFEYGKKSTTICIECR